MKRILLVAFCFICLQSKATTWDVNVQNFQFVPSSLNVMVGDVIHWVWIAGVHTTTSSSVPLGAAPWDTAMNVLSPSFSYTVTAVGSYSYFCKIHGALIMSGSFVASGVVPVTLSAFNINSQNDKPLLSWTTQTEMNSVYFSVRKSLNGKDFNEIAKVPAVGNSVIERNYSFVDQTPASGISYAYYSLGITDRDGKVQLSPIEVYKYKNAVRKLIISLSPNPIADMGHLMLQFNADKTGVMIAKLIDMQGKVVLNTKLSAVQGVNNAHIHLGEIPAGVYNMYFSLDGIAESYKIIKNQ